MGPSAHWASNELLVRALRRDAPTVARAFEELRLAEARLERRRRSAAAPSPLDEIVLRHVLDLSDAGEPATPSVLAELCGLTRPAMSVALRRLEGRGLVRVARHPDDGRRRVVLPATHADGRAGGDELTDAIRALAARMTHEEATFLIAFVEDLRRIIDDAAV